MKDAYRTDSVVLTGHIGRPHEEGDRMHRLYIEKVASEKGRLVYIRNTRVTLVYAIARAGKRYNRRIS